LAAAEAARIEAELLEAEKAKQAALDAENAALAAEQAKKVEAAKQKKIIAKLEAQDITIPILFAPDMELLMEVTLKGKAKVQNLIDRVVHDSRLPFNPRLLLNGTPLDNGMLSLAKAGIVHNTNITAELCPVVLTTSADCTAKVWSSLTGECEMTLASHSGPVSSAVCTADLKWIVTGSADMTAKCWAIDQANRVAMCTCTLKGHTKAINSVALSPDNKLVLTTSEDKSVKQWSMKSGKCLRTFDEIRGGVPLKAWFSADGLKIEALTKDTKTVWETESGIKDSSTKLDAAAVAAEAAAKGGAGLSTTDGISLAQADVNNIVISNVATNDLLRVLEGHSAEVTSVSLIALDCPRARNMIALKRMQEKPPMTPEKSAQDSMRDSLDKLQTVGMARPGSEGQDAASKRLNGSLSAGELRARNRQENRQKGLARSGQAIAYR
jgi:hypothetical protein